VRQIMTTGVESVTAQARLPQFLEAAVVHDALPVVDDHQRLLGMLHRSDLLQAKGSATAGSLARTQYPIAYADETVHEVALRMLEQQDHSCPVLDRETGELVGILTPYDLLKAKRWENLQEMQEPGKMSVFSLLRFRSRGVQSSAEQEKKDQAVVEIE
ncbi:MAG: CBS domain-containing protein, partial [Terriglobales bacterium]